MYDAKCPGGCKEVFFTAHRTVPDEVVRRFIDTPGLLNLVEYWIITIEYESRR